MTENKRCGLYIRVSTERQAKVQEGSLKTQRELLEAFVKSKSGFEGSNWSIVDAYVDEGKSAKDTNRQQFQRMLSDIHSGRVNVVLCTALSRISRSTRDLLEMVDNFEKLKVDFICLKEQFDTTTPQGKCFLTIMAALNQFEREQTSERTSAIMFGRAKRGLAQGCHVLGYDIDQNKKGHLIPNPAEAKLVNLMFDTYLEAGSILKTAQVISDKGFVTKEYASFKTAKEHGGKRFCYTSMHNILSNLTYIGMREVNKMNKPKKQSELPEERRYSVCKAVWEPIVDEEKFRKVQALIKDNLEHKNNGAVPAKHSYLFNGEILYCEKCGAFMEGSSGHGRKNRVYYYYVCSNRECRFRVRENELEAAVQKMIAVASTQQSMLNRIVDKLNAGLSARLPELREEKRDIENKIVTFDGVSRKLIDKFANDTISKDFIDKRLAELSQMKGQLKERLDILELEIDSLQREAIDEAKVRRLFGRFEDIFKDRIKFYQKKILLKWLLRNLKINADALSLDIDARRFRSDIAQLARSDMVADVSRGSFF